MGECNPSRREIEKAGQKKKHKQTKGRKGREKTLYKP